MKNVIILILLIVNFISCEKKETILTKDNSEIIKNHIVIKGDEDAFTDLTIKYGNSSKYGEILPYAMIMANKYNNGEGCYQVFMSVLSLNNSGSLELDISSIKKLNNSDKDFVMSYLLKGVKLKKPSCIITIEKLYRNGWGINKDIQKADEMKTEYKSIFK
ncbi:hypothetical protein [Chryseobacterium sp. S90]|uniref:hypothetical protein n=1 Tax=Chryseobacterium sp. S90 TaxID=3395373 RepID=UPI0039BD0741